MDWLWQLIDSLQKNAAFAALQHLSAFDWIVLFGVLWGLVHGGRQGFSEMFGKTFTVLLVSMLVMTFYHSAADSMRGIISSMPQEMSEAFSFFLLGVFVWISVSWTVNIIGKFLRLEVSGSLKFLGGMGLGVVYFVLLASFISQFLLFLPIESLQKVYKPGQSFSGQTVARIVPQIHEAIAQPFEKSVKTVKLSKS
ncbi:MAG TPA: CvpA family protein [Candidatus Omnitrophota bacterium]|nr:CvpA family protein [Candidatus Omnitrophota bacterium]HPS37656.1 CvpA family protein [Candidatus Omnitrophota bacterium]